MTPEEVVQAVMRLSENMTRPVYRGQADADWQSESGAIRRLKEAYGKDFPVDVDEIRRVVAQYHRDQLIMPMEVIDGSRLSDLQRLSVLQHHGAATGLLDFTDYPLIALWFACIVPIDKNARVFTLDIGDPQVAKNSRTLENQTWEDLFGPGHSVLYYEPERSLGARIVAQRSVFVICNPLIPDEYLKSVVVPRESKGKLLEYLRRLGLSETALFGDIPGLAAANATDKPLQRTDPPTPEQFRQRGHRAYQAGRYADALAAYESYASVRPDVAQPHSLKGDTLAALGRHEYAVLAYTKAIENLARPMYLGEQMIVNREPTVNLMAHALYYNRGNARAANDDHCGAVADFNVALRYGGGPKRDVLKNRGNSKFALAMFAEAHEDFAAAWSEREGSDAALAMGNCKVMTGEFDEALQRYLSGRTADSKRTAAHCQENADQVHKILKILNGHDFNLKREGATVFVQTTYVQGESLRFPFAGNQGNTGNTPSGMVTAPGGKGYEGAKGFAVAIVPAMS